LRGLPYGSQTAIGGTENVLAISAGAADSNNRNLPWHDFIRFKLFMALNIWLCNLPQAHGKPSEQYKVTILRKIHDI